MSLKEQYYNNPEDDVYAFDNIFNFIDFCYRNNYTPENSITEMEIKYTNNLKN